MTAANSSQRKQRHREADLEDSRRTDTEGEICYRSLFEGVPIGLYITTPDGRIVDANPALVEMLGYPDKDSLLGMKASQLYADPVDREKERTLLAQENIVQDFETQLRKRDGTTIWVHDTCRVVYGETGQIHSYEGSLQDITERREYERKLTHMARHDPLTGVFNRHALAEILESEISRARRYQHPIGILMIDVNRFKEVNDRFGHGTGDRVLCIVAEALCRSVRDSDIVIRYGGDEFLVLLVETDGETEIVKERIRTEMLQQGQMSFLSEFPVTLSIGTAHWDPGTGRSIESVLNQADRAMYKEKKRKPCPG
jgi:diguanylate cyclase (GGDEF)-like protein/PAS domain S-box-containing protein